MNPQILAYCLKQSSKNVIKKSLSRKSLSSYTATLSACGRRRFWTWYLRNTLRKFLQMLRKRPLGLKSEQIRFWWLKVKVRGSKKHIFGHCSTIYMQILKKCHPNVWEGKMMKCWHSISKRSRVSFTVTAKCSAKTPFGHLKAINEKQKGTLRPYFTLGEILICWLQSWVPTLKLCLELVAALQ